jgi:hypothetical protein
VKLNALLIFVIVTVTFVILFNSLFKERVGFQPKAAPSTSTIMRERVFLDPQRPSVLLTPPAPVVAELISSYPGKEIGFLTEKGDVYIYSSDFVFITSLPRVVNATVSASLQTEITASPSATYKLLENPVTFVVADTPGNNRPSVVYAKLHDTDVLHTALFVRQVQQAVSGTPAEFNELVGITDIDPQNSQDQIRISTELLEE